MKTNVHPIWESVVNSTVAVPIINVEPDYDRILKQTRLADLRPSSNRNPAMRAAWVFVGRVNELLPTYLYVPLRDDDRAIEFVDMSFEALSNYAMGMGCELHWSRWTVWAGTRDVIKTWRLSQPL